LDHEKIKCSVCHETKPTNESFSERQHKYVNASVRICKACLDKKIENENAEAQKVHARCSLCNEEKTLVD